jgi:hypothetical protein
MHHAIRVAAVLSFVGCSAALADGAVVYSNDFEGAVGSEWSSTATDVTPVGSRRFLGQFGNTLTTLSLTNLPGHDTVTLSFDLYLIRSWDGNNTTFGPDRWGCGFADNVQGVNGTALLDTTFSQFADTNYPQAYPAAFNSGTNNAAGTGAAETGTLGYTYSNSFGDTVYALSFTFPHSDSSIYFGFLADGLQDLNDESWGLDNVRVEVSEVPAPGTVLPLGLAGVVVLRRRR